MKSLLTIIYLLVFSCPVSNAAEVYIDGVKTEVRSATHIKIELLSRSGGIELKLMDGGSVTIPIPDFAASLAFADLITSGDKSANAAIHLQRRRYKSTDPKELNSYGIESIIFTSR